MTAHSTKAGVGLSESMFEVVDNPVIASSQKISVSMWEKAII